MEKLYWINGIKFVGLLKKHGYAWQSGEAIGSGTSIMEQIIKDAYAYVIAVNHVKKTIAIYPLEIYAPGSPTANAEKYKEVVDRCGDFADLENDVNRFHRVEGCGDICVPIEPTDSPKEREL